MSGQRNAVARGAGTILALIALGWTAWLLAREWGNVPIRALSPSVLPATLAFALLIGSMLGSFVSFRWALIAASTERVSLLRIMRLHFVAQLFKHLPGRFFGVVYQIASAADIATPGQWLAANAAYMLLTLWAAMLVPVSVLGVTGGIPAIAAAGAVLVLVAVPLMLRGRSLGDASTMLPPMRRIVRLVDSSLCLLARKELANATLWMLFSWGLYLVAWVVFAEAIDGLGASAGARLCALYTLAWAAGFLSILTPSGFGVRELVFAVLASDFSPEVVAYVAVLGRVALVAADLLLGLAFLPRSRHA